MAITPSTTSAAKQKLPETVAVAKHFVHSAFRTIDDDRLMEWVRSLTKELARRLAMDRRENKRSAKQLLMAIMYPTGELQGTAELMQSAYTSPESLTLSVRDFMAQNAETLKDQLGGWRIVHIHLSAQGFKRLSDAGTISTWLASVRTPTADELEQQNKEKDVNNLSTPTVNGNKGRMLPSTSVQAPLHNADRTAPIVIEVLDSDGDEERDDAVSIVPVSEAGTTSGQNTMRKKTGVKRGKAAVQRKAGNEKKAIKKSGQVGMKQAALPRAIVELAKVGRTCKGKITEHFLPLQPRQY